MMAIASSLVIISIKSLVGFTGDLMHTSVDWSFLSKIILLATTGIITGNYLNKKIDRHNPTGANVETHR